MTQTLVPQVKQLTRAQIEEHLQTNVVPYEVASQSPSFRLGEGVHQYVEMFWKMSEAIQNDGLAPVSPFCMHSDSEDGGWNFSWGLDNPITDESTRSCFYTFYADGSVKCREYPDDVIVVNKVLDAWNLVCVIISDLVQSHDWDKQQTAMRVDALLQKAMQRDEA